MYLNKNEKPTKSHNSAFPQGRGLSSVCSKLYAQGSFNILSLFYSLLFFLCFLFVFSFRCLLYIKHTGFNDFFKEIHFLELPGDQHSSKGGAVETGCSGLHYVICCFII